MLLLLCMLASGLDWHYRLAYCQDDATATDSSVQSIATQSSLERLIEDLNDSNFRKRQLARWKLEQTPLESIQAIEACLGGATYNSGAQLVDVLSSLATHADISVSIRARQVLLQYANRVSAIGRLADNSLRAIADLQEEQALQILRHHGARFGPSYLLQLVFNGKPPVRDPSVPDDFAIVIDDSFTGDDEVIAWIQFLKSVDTVYFEGEQIRHQHFLAIADLPNIKKLKCKNVAVSQADLLLFKNFISLKILEIAYADIDDSYLTILGELPMSETLRLFGTQITTAGAQQLARQLDGIEIYCGKGGYLGISTHPSNTEVLRVGSNSGAERAGIRGGDRLTHVHGVEISDMSDLRAQLAKHAAGDKVPIKLTRKTSQNGPRDELTVTVTLTEDPN